MKIPIINKQEKKIYIVEIILSILLIIIIIAGIYLFVINAKDKVITRRNESRKRDLLDIAQAIEKYINSDENASNYLINNLKPCVVGWQEIGQQDEQIDLKSILVPNYIDKINSDPLCKQDQEICYDICRSDDLSIIQLRAPKSEIEDIIVTYKLKN